MKRRAYEAVRCEILDIELDYENNLISYEELEDRKEEILKSSGWTLDIYEIEVENQARHDERFIYKKIR